MKNHLTSLLSLFLFVFAFASTTMIFAQEEETVAEETTSIDVGLAEETLVETKLNMPTPLELKASKSVLDDILKKEIGLYVSRKQTASALTEKCRGLLEEAEESATKYLLYQYISEYYALFSVSR